MEIFDAHTHFFGRDSYEFHTVRQPNGTAEILPVCSAGSRSKDFFADEHLDRIIAGMDACGVSRAVTYASVPQEMGTVGEAALRSNGRLVPFATINPVSTAPMDTLQRLQSKYRFRGIVLFPAMHQFSVSDRKAAVAFDLAQSSNMIVLAHFSPLRINVRELIGLDSGDRLDHCHPAELVPVAQSRKDQRFVVSHRGPDLLDELLHLGASGDNVYADTSGVSSWLGGTERSDSLAGVFRELRKAFGIERLLFGSDSGGTPWVYRGDTLDTQIEGMNEAGFTEDERAAVLGGNLTGLLKLTRG